jgi:hypothetical protein
MDQRFEEIRKLRSNGLHLVEALRKVGMSTKTFYDNKDKIHLPSEIKEAKPKKQYKRRPQMITFDVKPSVPNKLICLVGDIESISLAIKSLL